MAAAAAAAAASHRPARLVRPAHPANPEATVYLARLADRVRTDTREAATATPPQPHPATVAVLRCPAQPVVRVRPVRAAVLARLARRTEAVKVRLVPPARPVLPAVPVCPVLRVRLVLRVFFATCPWLVRPARRVRLVPPVRKVRAADPATTERLAAWENQATPVHLAVPVDPVRPVRLAVAVAAARAALATTARCRVRRPAIKSSALVALDRRLYSLWRRGSRIRFAGTCRSPAALLCRRSGRASISLSTSAF